MDPESVLCGVSFLLHQLIAADGLGTNGVENNNIMFSNVQNTSKDPRVDLYRFIVIYTIL